MENRKALDALIAFVVILLFVALPSYMSIRAFALSPQHAFVIFSGYCFALGFTSLLLLAASRIRSVRASYALAVAVALYYFLIALSLAYWALTGSQLDLFFVLDGLPILISTLTRTLGLLPFLLALSLLLAVFVVILRTVFQLQRRLRQCCPSLFGGMRILLPLTVFCAGLYVSAGPYTLFWSEITKAVQVFSQREIIHPTFTELEPPKIVNAEPVFMLQLESGNAMAQLGEYPVAGTTYSGPFLPTILKLAQNGVLMPFFWANSIQSHRSLMNILCAVNNEIGQALSFRPELLPFPCLPQLLKEQGYRTLLYWGFDNPHFTNLDNAFRKMGFEAQYHSDIVSAAHRNGRWGIDDCEFYPVLFDHLRAQASDRERLFVYIKVSSHHFPFDGNDRYASVHRFNPPRNFAENFLNSALEQDHCVTTFYEQYLKFTNGNGHLFIFPDQSWPLGMHGTIMNEQGAFNENFLIPMLYLPPESRAESFAVGERLAQRFGLTDLAPTILELLTNKSYPNSFAAALMGKKLSEDYEACQVLVQPYGGGDLAIVRGDEKLVYHVATKQLMRFNLDTDWFEKSGELIGSALDYGELREKYYCARYK